MKFLYKIYSRYDGFTPKRLPERLSDDGLLKLGWQKYLDAVEEQDEIWVYFYGGSFEHGVYVKGIAASKDEDQPCVWLKIQEFSTSEPLTDARTSAEIAQIVSIRYRQVFFVPDAWRTVANCSLSTTASTCANRRCGDCATWRQLPRVDPRLLRRPERMETDTIAAFAPAFWAIPSRSQLWYDRPRVRRGIDRTDGLFRRFKVGDDKLTYPFALAMVEQLRKAAHIDFDAVVPIPLSPEKAAAGEFNRTKALAEEISRQLRTPIRQLLTLSGPVGKRILKSAGWTTREFEREYARALVVDAAVADLTSVLLVDDACTAGSTLEQSAEMMLAVNPRLKVVATVAAQMTVKHAVLDPSKLLEP